MTPSQPIAVPPGTALSQLVDCVVERWPEHRTFLAKRFGDDYRTLDGVSERIARKIVTIAGAELPAYCDDYRWFCGTLLAEELHFRRSGEYRLSDFASAQREVYDNPAFMSRYTNGILVSQVLWANHTGAYAAYVERYLPGNPPGYSHLEIGPGHGLLLSEAATDPRCAELTGWDVSASSLRSTAHCLQQIGPRRAVRLEQHDIFALSASAGQFDSVVLSEVLEHLERPDRALEILATLLRPRGRTFIAAPVNSPAPDHIFLFRTPGDLAAMVRASGLVVEQIEVCPVTGYTVERAMRNSLTITCAIVARAA
jgi:2-polyprenyl-3-methyl-5-hydroxy-6-metoxy-1,4-benzoquinol methylase